MTPRQVLGTVLAVAATLVAAPAPAKPPAYAVWEVYRVSAGGPAEVPVRVSATGEGQGPTLLLFAELAPAEDGGYEPRGIMLMSGGGIEDTRWRTYGWPAPVPPPACPAAPLCGSPGKAGGVNALFSFRPEAGGRYLVGAPRNARLTSLSGRWRIRRTTLGLRTLHAEQTDATGVVSGLGRIEHFRSATAAGGPHGSLVFTEVPCDAGQWRLTDGDAVSVGGVCPLMSSWTFESTPRKQTWRLTGDAFGQSTMPIRLVVLDHPKR